MLRRRDKEYRHRSTTNDTASSVFKYGSSEVTDNNDDDEDDDIVVYYWSGPPKNVDNASDDLRHQQRLTSVTASEQQQQLIQQQATSSSSSTQTSVHSATLVLVIAGRLQVYNFNHTILIRSDCYTSHVYYIKSLQ